MASRTAIAEPWVAPGELLLRSDLQLLADRGILHVPLQTWPLSWGDIARDLQSPTVSEALTSAELAALGRVRERVRVEASSSEPLASELRLALAHEPRTLRTFEDTPREDGELQAGVHWTGLRFSYRLQATVVTDPQDDQTVRPDGSYFGAVVGNWMLAAGYMERWWGPGWDGSLILSSNARPLPGISVNRNYSDPFPVPVLRSLGPWSATVTFGQFEHDATVSDALFFGARVDFRPLQSLEIGLSRTAQWCGEGRPCDTSAFFDLLVGNDNRGSGGVTRANEPGNQLAGADFRWSAARHGWPLALYGQLIGEDEAGGLPSRFIGQFGIELWSAHTRLGSYRLHLEAADTTADFLGDPRYDYAYEHFIYKDGYRYRGRSLGHSLDNDGRLYSLGGVLARDNGDAWTVLIAHAELNRGGGVDNRNTVSNMPADLYDLEVGYERSLGPGRLQLGLGYENIDPQSGGGEEHARAFAEWRWQR